MSNFLVSLLAVAHGVLVAAAAWAAPWRQVIGVSSRLHLLLGSTALLALLWEFGRGAWSLLGLTTVTLLFGAPLAIVAGSMAHCAQWLGREFDLATVLASAWIEVAIPVTVSWLMLSAVTRWGPNNLFAYTLGAGFLGGALSRAAELGVFVGLSGYDLALEAIVLLAFAEGFVNGMLVTAFAVYKPHWMRTLDERRYIDGA